MKKKMTEAVMVMPERKSTASIQLGKDLLLPRLSVGKTVTVVLSGRITNLNDDDWGKGFSMKLSAVVTDDGMGGEIKKMNKFRKMVNLTDLDEFDE